MRKEFKRLCNHTLKNVPAFAIPEMQRVELFAIGSKVFMLRTEEIKQVYKEVFGYTWDEK